MTSSIQKPWFDAYPAGVAHDIDISAYRNLTQFLEESFKKNAASPFSVCMDQWMTYGEVDQASYAFGAWLQKLGLPAGSRVAIMLPNIPQFAVTMSAILRAGFVCVNVNPLYTARELKHQLRDSGATTIVILENFAHTLEEVIEYTPIDNVVVASMGDMLGFWFGRWITFAVRHLARMVPAFKLPVLKKDGQNRTVVSFKDMLSQSGTLTLKPPAQTLSDTAFLQYTGGTTGLSKGAVLTHGNVIAAILQAHAWLCNKNQLHHCFAPLSHIRTYFMLGHCALGLSHDSYS
jgi:acyl-CoA synthetase (AMP-forming)/AMP-acid ligase II